MDAPLDSCEAVRERLQGLGSRPPVAMPADVVPASFRRAAVLFLVGCVDGRPALVLTERGAHLRSHAAQVSLPGGRIEPDETPEEAALREAEEEVGAAADDVEVLGRIDEAWSGAGNLVTTVVGWYRGDLARLRPTSHEVAQVFVLSLEELAHPRAHEVHVVSHMGAVYENDAITVAGVEIWGLTADLVLDLLQWLRGEDPGRVPRRTDELRRWMGTIEPN